MSLTDPTIADKIRALPNNVKMITGVIVLIVAIGAVLFGIDKCDTYRFDHGMTKANANLANAFNGLANIQDQKAEAEKHLQQLKEQEAAQKQAVIDAAKDAEIAAKNEANADNAANQAAANVNAVNAQDFNGTTLANAQRARCLAFPDSEGCKP